MKKTIPTIIKNSLIFVMIPFLLLACIPLGGVGSGNNTSPAPAPISPLPGPTSSPIVGWNPTSAVPSVSGRANNIGFASDQLGNLYLSYQGENTFSIYQYLFNQASYQWQQIYSATVQQQSLASYSTSMAIDRRGNFYVEYLTQPTSADKVNISYFYGLSDKTSFTTATKITHPYPYVYQVSPGKTSSYVCTNAPRSFEDTASGASMTLDGTDFNQVIAYSDTTQVGIDTQPGDESGSCVSKGYIGGGKLTVYDTNLSFEARAFTVNATSQVQIAATPPLNVYPIYVAYKDSGNNNGITVQKQIANGAPFTIVGTAGFTGYADNLSLAVDTKGNPYVAYEARNYLLAVKKFDGSNWIDVGTGNITSNIATGISLSINPRDDSLIVAYQDGSLIKVKQFDGTNWVAFGSDLANISNNYGPYTNLIMRQTSPTTWQPAIAYQATPPSQTTSTLSIFYYIPPT